MLVVTSDEGEVPSRLGHVIGNYRLLRVLGTGGAGTVYEVEHVRLGRKRAIKLLHPEVTPDLVARFFNEARAVNTIRHPNIIDIEDFVTTDTGESFTVMELLAGEDLRAALEYEPKLAPARVAALGAQLAEALAAAHAVGIVHRDLKPENIFLVQRDGKEIPKLLDFGVAKFLDDTTGLTRADMTLGTPNYMAPEQILTGKKVGPESDLYSLGMVMYECLTGAPAFAGQARAGVLRAHCFARPAPPSEKRGDPVPPVLESIVLRCLEKAPGDRFANAAELARAFGSDTPVELPSSGTPPATPVDEPAPAPAPPRRRRRVLQLIPAAALLVAAVVVLAWPHGGDAGPVAPPVVTAPPPPPARAVEPPPPKPAAPATFQLTLVSQPPGAHLTSGADALGVAPVTITVPIATTPMSIVAHFDDGRETAHTIVPDRPRAELAFVAPAPVAKPPPAPPPPRPKPPQDRDAPLDPFK